MMGDLIEQIKADREAGMPDLGGWAWFGGRDDLYLATNRGGRRYVMGFKRKGMRSAQPTFQIGGIMHGAIDDLTDYAVGDGDARGQKEADEDPSVYRMDVKSVDHPDARRIARVPEMEQALIDQAAEIERLRAALVQCRDEIDAYILQEYPSEHPVHQRCRGRDMAANPARAALEPSE